jgi:dihydroneopterin triphosphate diphosphatase
MPALWLPHDMAGAPQAAMLDGMTALRPHKIPESVLVVIHTPALDVLLLERADRPGFWQTCRREVEEETGIVVGTPAVPVSALRDWELVNLYEIYPVWRHRYAPGVTHNREHVFSLCVDPATPVRLAPREHLDHAWLPWREAADRCFSPSNAEAILQLVRRSAG